MTAREIHSQDVDMQTVLLRIHKHYAHETQIVLLGNRVYPPSLYAIQVSHA